MLSPMQHSNQREYYLRHSSQLLLDYARLEAEKQVGVDCGCGYQLTDVTPTGESGCGEQGLDNSSAFLVRAVFPVHGCMCPGYQKMVRTGHCGPMRHSCCRKDM